MILLNHIIPDVLRYYTWNVFSHLDTYDIMYSLYVSIDSYSDIF